MKAILLAAGLGTRLRPITDSIPKCLVPIAGEPLLGLWIKKLLALGVSDILINTHYFAEQVEAFVRSLNSEIQSKITLVYEAELLGTGGTLIANRAFWENDTCFVIHADNFCTSSLSAMLIAHDNRPSQTDCTLLVFETDKPQSCGIVQLDQENIVTEFHEKVQNPPGNLASGALFLFSPNVFPTYFREYCDKNFVDLSADIIPKMVGKLYAWKVNGVFMDIGTLDTYNRANTIGKDG
ncbi:Mannose-1-phosphate guanylyltransferase [Pseudoalteromonas luteoviolacea B = ATCC 29581]|nr:Mannose-1-phosphate guanylyltransferase [Pseudoalteromonas luteoviolacea B = ATCC 29581]